MAAADVLGGAASGAAAGAALGPYGALAGGVIGGGLALLRSRAAKKEAQRAAMAREAERQRQLAALQPAMANAADLYAQNVRRADRSYQAGPIRDVDASQQVSRQNMALERQNMGLNQLQAAAEGRGPSAATAQYQSALLAGQQQALGQVAAARGAERGAARLQALAGFGGQAQQAAVQSAALRAQEMQAAQQQYATAQQQYAAGIQGARGQDIQTSGLGIDRDVATDAAGRQAFATTQDAQRGYLEGARGAVGAQLDVGGAQSGIIGGEVATAASQAEEARKRAAGQNQSLVNTAVDLYTKFKQPAAGQGNVVTRG